MELSTLLRRYEGLKEWKGKEMKTLFWALVGRYETICPQYLCRIRYTGRKHNDNESANETRMSFGCCVDAGDGDSSLLVQIFLFKFSFSALVMVLGGKERCGLCMYL